MSTDLGEDQMKLKDRLINEMLRLKERYKNIMHETELDEIFDKKDIELSFDESDCFVSHLTFQLICGLFIVVIVCITVVMTNLN